MDFREPPVRPSGMVFGGGERRPLCSLHRQNPDWTENASPKPTLLATMGVLAVHAVVQSPHNNVQKRTLLPQFSMEPIDPRENSHLLHPETPIGQESRLPGAPQWGGFRL